MKSINLLVRIILLLPLLILPAGCGGGGGGGGGGGAPAAPTLLSISVTPANSSIVAGGSQQFTATGTFSDGSTQPLTQVTWSASGIVQIGGTSGLATSSLSSGTATITATVGNVSGSTTLTVTGGSSAAANVMSITVNGALCSPATSAGYFNKPCVSVTVCNPGGGTCQTVSDILLDTGSYGLRIFSQALTGLTLPQVSSGTGFLAECIQFADNSSIWGPVKTASVQLGGEPAVQMPIQVIDSSYATPTSCGTPDPTPVKAGYTGILGVGPLALDCGPACFANTRVGVYFSCTGASCVGTTAPAGSQVPNPVAKLPFDNNGVLVLLAAAPPGGVNSLSGSLILGIGTRANNTPSVAPTVIPTNQQGDFTTVFNAVTSLNSFLDTGSNALFFPSTITQCTIGSNSWYCPPATTSFNATLMGTSGSPSAAVPFSIGNAPALFATSNNVFSEIGGPSTFGFDWGLPFFMGKSVFIGINGTASPNLGTGPFVAF